MNVRELREKNDEELAKELLDLHRQALNLRIQAGIGQSTRPSEIRNVRRNIARVKTILNEREV